ncbi:hypothetical protein HaLaN_22656 [Haematococcus lacustris]|uniref:Uncharacterized protein n=1 Tax=Haematococcus lacustris TaxID=44745 RepID=A0A699ZPN7_HAELA|nr:hypothetical protein HaLaN_22656 [Haematococcus lacustris]
MTTIGCLAHPPLMPVSPRHVALGIVRSKRNPARRPEEHPAALHPLRTPTAGSTERCSEPRAARSSQARLLPPHSHRHGDTDA